MEKYHLETDIPIFCVTAKSFPEGVLESHEKLHALIPFSAKRKYFGISSPNEKSEIIYKAAAEEMQNGESEKLNCERFIIRKGNYISIEIKNFMTDITSIEKAFQELISHPGIDPSGVCVEWYLNRKDVRCMVKLIQ